MRNEYDVSKQEIIDTLSILYESAMISASNINLSLSGRLTYLHEAICIEQAIVFLKKQWRVL